MAVRFRIRTSQGQEVSFASPEGFEAFVRAGDLAPDDLVYDVETGEWAPARTHPLVLQFEYEREAAEARSEAEVQAEAGAGDDADELAERAAGGPEAEERARDPNADATTDEASEQGPSDATTDEAPEQGLSLVEPGTATQARSDDDAPEQWAALDSADFGLELAPSAGPLTPAEESQRFVERMQSERELDRDLGETTVGSGIRMEGAGALADMVRAEDAPPDPPRSPPEPRRRGAPALAHPRAGTKPPRKKSGSGARIAAGLVTLAVLGGGGYAAYAMRAVPVARGDPSSDPEPIEPLPVPNEPPPVIAATTEAVRARARERFLTATQAALADLEPVPEVWSTGGYFSLPSDYPQVPRVWEQYRRTALAVRASGPQRYRVAYARALDDAGIREDPTRSLRLDAGVAAFDARLPDLQAHWDRVVALAEAALQSHRALVEAEGLILYDPTLSTGRPDGLGAGTSGRDSDSELLLDQVIQLLGRALDADGLGPRDGANVREWAWGGFLDVMSR